MMFLFAGHSAGLLSKNFVKQRLHENFRIPAPWLTKEIIFVCTVFLSFTLRMTCGRTLIHARSTLWTAPQSLRFTLWNSGYWMSAYKERWRQNAVKFKWHSFKRLSQYLKCSPPQNRSYRRASPNCSKPLRILSPAPPIACAIMIAATMIATATIIFPIKCWYSFISITSIYSRVDLHLTM